MVLDKGEIQMVNQLGNYSFIIGAVIAIVLGLAGQQLLGTLVPWLQLLLVLLGLTVGFLNISGKETREFLWVTVALVIVAYAGSSQINTWKDIQFIGNYLKGVFDSILAFVIPASVVASLKEIWRLAKGSE